MRLVNFRPEKKEDASSVKYRFPPLRSRANAWQASEGKVGRTTRVRRNAACPVGSSRFVSRAKAGDGRGL